MNNKIPDSVVGIEGYSIYRRDRDWEDIDKRKKGGVAIYVREHLKVLAVKRDSAFEMLSVRLLLPSSHEMLVIGVYHPPKVNYMENELIDTITSVTDDFLDSVPDGAILCGGDLNRLNLEHLSTVSGLTALVDFPTRGDATLDNCLTNKPGLFQTPYPYKNLIKTDHISVILPPGNKLKPLRTKYQFRDYREHRKLEFANKIQACDWSHVLNTQDVDCATNRLNDTLHNMMDSCFPVKTVTMSTRDPPGLPHF